MKPITTLVVTRRCQFPSFEKLTPAGGLPVLIAQPGRVSETTRETVQEGGLEAALDALRLDPEVMEVVVERG